MIMRGSTYIHCDPITLHHQTQQGEVRSNASYEPPTRYMLFRSLHTEIMTYVWKPISHPPHRSNSIKSAPVALNAVCFICHNCHVVWFSYFCCSVNVVLTVAKTIQSLQSRRPSTSGSRINVASRPLNGIDS